MLADKRSRELPEAEGSDRFKVSNLDYAHCTSSVHLRENMPEVAQKPHYLVAYDVLFFLSYLVLRTLQLREVLQMHNLMYQITLSIALQSPLRHHCHLF